MSAAMCFLSSVIGFSKNLLLLFAYVFGFFRGISFSFSFVLVLDDVDASDFVYQLFEEVFCRKILE
jgi:hypothetical protein